MLMSCCLQRFFTYVLAEGQIVSSSQACAGTGKSLMLLLHARSSHSIAVTVFAGLGAKRLPGCIVYICRERNSVFFTGCAGTGKPLLLKCMLHIRP